MKRACARHSPEAEGQVGVAGAPEKHLRPGGIGFDTPPAAIHLTQREAIGGGWRRTAGFEPGGDQRQVSAPEQPILVAAQEAQASTPGACLARPAEQLLPLAGVPCGACPSEEEPSKRVASGGVTVVAEGPGYGERGDRVSGDGVASKVRAGELLAASRVRQRARLREELDGLEGGFGDAKSLVIQVSKLRAGPSKPLATRGVEPLRSERQVVGGSLGAVPQHPSLAPTAVRVPKLA